MKKQLKITLSLISLLAIQIVQDQKLKEEIKANQRSALHNILIVGDSFDKAEVVKNAYQSGTFPGKYNDQRIDVT